jgi:hypothetical protein
MKREQRVFIVAVIGACCFPAGSAQAAPSAAEKKGDEAIAKAKEMALKF